MIVHNRKYVSKEIIIVNPDIIEGFTADPVILQADLARDHATYLEIQNMKNSAARSNAEENFAISPDLYFIGEGNGFIKHLQPILDNYNKTDRQLLPSFYLEPLN